MKSSSRQEKVLDFVNTAFAPDQPSNFSMFSEDVVLHTPNGRRTGPSGIQEDVDIWKRGFPDARITDVTIQDRGDVIIVNSVGRGTHTKPFRGIEATNRKVALGAETIYCFEGDRVVRYYAQLNMEDFFTQLGLPNLQLQAPRTPEKQLFRKELSQSLQNNLNLSPQPTECLSLHITGFSPIQIGNNLHISSQTANTDCQAALSQLGCGDRHSCIEYMNDRILLSSCYDLALLLL